MTIQTAVPFYTKCGQALTSQRVGTGGDNTVARQDKTNHHHPKLPTSSFCDKLQVRRALGDKIMMNRKPASELRPSVCVCVCVCVCYNRIASEGDLPWLIDCSAHGDEV